MSGVNFVDTVTVVPATWANTVNALVYNVFGAATTLQGAQAALRLQSLAYQAHNNVNIEGGNINNVMIGTQTPVQRFVAQAARVLDDPIDDRDVVNKGWMRAWIQNALTVAQAEWLGGLGSIAVQNANNVNIIGGTLNNTDIGLLGRASGRFTALKASNPPIDGDDVVTLGYLSSTYDVLIGRLRSMAYQDSNAVAITGGEIDGTRIGFVTPATGRFSRASVVSPPSALEDITNKRYVDGSITAFASTLRSMAYQDANNVNIIGGSINGTAIGNLTPATIRASDLTVINNASWLTLRTTSSGAANSSGIRFQDGVTVVGTLAYYGANNPIANANQIVFSANVPFRLESNGAGSGIIANGVNLTLFGGLTRLAASASDRVVVGSGAPVGAYQFSANLPAWFQQLDARRVYSEQGHSDGYDSTYAGSASGSITLPVATRSAIFVNLTGTASVAFPAPVPGWTGLRVVRVIVRHDVGGVAMTWPSNVYWGSGVAPDYTDAASQDFDMVELWTFNGGVTWFANSAYGASMQYEEPPTVVFFAAS